MRTANFSTRFKVLELIESFGETDPIKRGRCFKAVYEEAMKYGIHDSRTLRKLVSERLSVTHQEIATDLLNVEF